MMPAWRMPPPSILRQRRPSVMKSRLPQSTEPTGAPSPFDRHTETESKSCAIVRGGTPCFTAAFHSRAPSRCMASPRAAANSRTAAA